MARAHRTTDHGPRETALARETGSSPASLRAGDLFSDEMQEYLRESGALAREEARILEEHRRESARLRQAAGQRYAQTLGLSDEWADCCAALILSPSLRWRLKACRAILAELRKRSRQRRAA